MKEPFTAEQHRLHLIELEAIRQRLEMARDKAQAEYLRDIGRLMRRVKFVPNESIEDVPKLAPPP